MRRDTGSFHSNTRAEYVVCIRCMITSGCSFEWSRIEFGLTLEPLGIILGKFILIHYTFDQMRSDSNENHIQTTRSCTRRPRGDDRFAAADGGVGIRDQQAAGTGNGFGNGTGPVNATDADRALEGSNSPWVTDDERQDVFQERFNLTDQHVDTIGRTSNR